MLKSAGFFCQKAKWLSVKNCIAQIRARLRFHAKNPGIRRFHPLKGKDNDKYHVERTTSDTLCQGRGLQLQCQVYIEGVAYFDEVVFERNLKHRRTFFPRKRLCLFSGIEQDPFHRYFGRSRSSATCKVVCNRLFCHLYLSRCRWNFGFLSFVIMVVLHWLSRHHVFPSLFSELACCIVKLPSAQYPWCPSTR